MTTVKTVGKRKKRHHGHEGPFSQWCFTCLRDRLEARAIESRVHAEHKDTLLLEVTGLNKEIDWLKGELKIKENTIQELTEELKNEKSKSQPEQTPEASGDQCQGS